MSAQTSTRYTSTFAESVRKEAAKTKASGTLYGPPGSRKPDPKQFTKRGKGNSIRDVVKERNTEVAQQEIKMTALAPGSDGRLDTATRNYVPRKTERGTIAPRSKKDFVKQNAQEATKYVSPKRTQNLTQVVGGSLKKGEIPSYLTARKAAVAKESEIEAALQAQAAQDPSIKRISDDERESLLAGLKKNYSDLYTQYLHLSVVIDTASKRQEKNNMEAKLAELEGDIAKIERSTEIFVQAF